jgi:hypothetical protein
MCLGITQSGLYMKGRFMYIKKKSIEKIYNLMSNHVLIYDAHSIMKEGQISRYAFVIIMSILEKELKIKHRRRKYKP